MNHRSHPAHPARRIIIVTLAFVLVAGSLLLGRAFLTPHAASAAPAPPSSEQTCAQAPSDQTCTGQSPTFQGCNDPMMYGIASKDIRGNNGNVVGRIDERYAPNCKSWWVRAFVYQPGYILSILIDPFPDGGLYTYTFARGQYTSMIYGGPGATRAPSDYSVEVDAVIYGEAGVIIQPFSPHNP